MPTRPSWHPLRVWLIFVMLSGAGHAAAEEGETLVQTYCAACHSLALVYSQSGNNGFWRDIIDLMRAKHNLGPIPPEQETAIVDYLATRAVTGPVEGRTQRRAPLEPVFLPGVR
ncbi:MAG: cytochrome c [Gammaproteobacteria bacterium]|nr:cytochrome c [Gammaproteobacteria bacterium]